MKTNKIKIRPEENALLLWNGDDALTAYISGEELVVLQKWATEGTDTTFTLRLKRMGLIEDDLRDDIIRAIARSSKVTAPLHSLSAPESLHIELTAVCPLNCPQCDKPVKKSVLPYGRLSEVLADAEAAGVLQITLGGGEPATYPHLTEAVAEAHGRGMAVSVTTSGTGLDKLLLDRLITVGLDHLQVSLNGSTEEINKQSREGYHEAVNALRLASKAKLSFGVNWVARQDNLDDLPALITLAGSFKANNVNILRYKPCSREPYHEIALTGSRLIKLAEIIKSTKRITIKVDSAFSNLLCHLNGRADTFSGCGAGRRFIALDATGNFRPCSHIHLASDGGTLLHYWQHSDHLAAFRSLEETIGEECKSCHYLNGCRGCRAITTTLTRFEDGEKNCIFSKLG